MTKTILILGATGMVGSFVLKELLNDRSVSKIISIGRRKTGIESEKLVEILHTNFLDFSDLKKDLKGIDVCFYCIGVYQNMVSKKDFYKITCDYQKALTDVLEETSPNLTFVLFSASGADVSEKSRVTFSRAKGTAENLLKKTVFPKKYIFRPGYIHPTGDKKPSGMIYTLLLPLAGMVFKLFPNFGIEDKDLAFAMVSVGLDESLWSNTSALENRDIKKLVT